MGEFAIYQGERVKIGTCENMYYLRFDQRTRVFPLTGNVDPVKDVGELRFRFPFPDEDRIEPGNFTSYDRAVEIPRYEPRPQFAAALEKPPVPPFKIVQQRLVENELQVVVRDSDGQLFRLSCYEAARATECFLEAVQDESYPVDDRQFYLDVARRVIDGYSVNDRVNGF